MTTVQEIKTLERLRDQTFSDLKEFVENREKVHWRTWDRYKQANWRKFSWFRVNSNGMQDVRQQID
jgi:hypothetical protein